MAEDTQIKLNRAIDAAKRGDRTTARQLLQSVVLQDRTNEVAWLWLASTSDSLDEKRKCLERVLQINPDNATARQGLQQLGAVSTRQPASGGPAQRSGNNPEELRRSLITYAILAAVLISAVLLVLIIVNAVRSALPGDNANLSPLEISQRLTQTELAQPTITHTPLPSASPTLPGVIVSLQPPTLPPTFTPTDAPTASPTPQPTATTIPLNTYTLLYTSFTVGSSSPSLVQISGDGTGENNLGIDSAGIAIHPDGRRAAFVGEGENGGLEVFVGPLNNLQQAQAITELNANEMSAVSWSNDGQLAFVIDRTALNVINENGSGLRTLLQGEETGNKSDPVWSPDGTQLVFASDQDNPGFTELYAYTFETNTTEQLTNDIGSSYSPAWSPDGQTIAFISDRGGDGDVYIIEAGGDSPRLLTSDDGGAEDQSTAWSPDGRWIAFASNRNGGTFQIYMVNREGTVLEQVTTGDRNNRAPTFRP